MALLAEDIPQHHRIFLRLPVCDTNLRQPRQQLFRAVARGRNAGKIAFDIGHKHRHADGGEGFCQLLQRHGFTGAGRTGYQSVTVSHGGQQMQLKVRRLGDQQWGSHDVCALRHCVMTQRIASGAREREGYLGEK